MPSLFKAIRNYLRAKKDETAEAIGDDIRDGKYAIEDSKKVIQQFRTDISRLIADNKSVERNLNAALDDVKKWTSIKAKADESGNTNDSSQAQSEIDSAKARAVTFKKQSDANSVMISKLRDQLAKAEGKIAAAQSNYQQLAARKRGAEIRKSLAQASTNLAGNSPLAALDDLQRAVESTEDEASSLEEMAGGGTSALEEKYEAGKDAVDSEFNSMFADHK